MLLKQSNKNKKYIEKRVLICKKHDIIKEPQRKKCYKYILSVPENMLIK